eukprot:415428-Hanusia_phi.AAC.1
MDGLLGDCLLTRRRGARSEATMSLRESRGGARYLLDPRMPGIGVLRQLEDLPAWKGEAMKGERRGESRRGRERRRRRGGTLLLPAADLNEGGRHSCIALPSDSVQPEAGSE